MVGLNKDKVITDKQQETKGKKYEKKNSDTTKIPKSNGLSAGTVKYIHSLVLQALDQAVKEKLIAYNPASSDSVKLPKREKPEIQPMFTEQAKSFLQAIKEDYLYPVFLTGLSTGLRRGELLGLKWSDIDFQAKTASIKRSLVLVNNKPVLQESVKTKGSKRVVSLTDDCLTELTRLKERQKEEKVALEEGL